MHITKEKVEETQKEAMASEQVRRDNTTKERKVEIENDRVPKMTSHFESLAIHVQPSDANHQSRKDQSSSHEHFESLAGKVGGDTEAEGRRDRGGAHDVGKFEMRDSETERPSNEGRGREEQKQSHGQQEQQHSLEEISKLRGQAQQNSMEAIKAAEERYNQAKEAATQKLGGASQHAKQRGSQAKDTNFGKGFQAQKTPEMHTEEGSQAKDTEKGSQAQGAYTVKETALEKGTQAKDTVLQAANTVKDTAFEKGTQAKDTVLKGAQTASQTVTEKGSQAKDTLLEKGSPAKDTVLEGAQRTSQLVAEKGSQAKDTAIEKASQAKDTAVDTGMKVASYTGEKVAAAKDVTVESGKGAAEYAGNVAADVKDRAAVAGWSAAHYTTEKAMEGSGVVAKAAEYTAEKAVEGTKAAARAVQGAAEYAGHKAVEIASKPLGAAKEAVVSTGESMKDYTARKKEDAEARRAQREQDTERSYEGGGNESITSKAEETVKELARPVASTVQQTIGGVTEQGTAQEGYTEGKQGTASEVLSAIGETVVEIAQTTTGFVGIGGHSDDQTSQTEFDKPEKRHEQSN